jgi:hypothetical protein
MKRSTKGLMYEFNKYEERTFEEVWSWNKIKSFSLKFDSFYTDFSWG